MTSGRESLAAVKMGLSKWCFSVCHGRALMGPYGLVSAHIFLSLNHEHMTVNTCHSCSEAFTDRRGLT